MESNDIAVFYDSCVFSPTMSMEPHYSYLKHLIDDSVNLVTNTVLDEIKNGKAIRQSEVFNLILKRNNRLRSTYNILNINNCIKQQYVNNKICREMFIKQSPLTCSAYHVWLPSAINPAIETSQIRHVYNDCLYSMVSASQDSSVVKDLNETINRFNNFEIRQYEKSSQNQDLKDTRARILAARTKRKKAFLAGNYKLTDYQLVTSAVIWACQHRIDTFIVTCDKDIVDIKNNLFDSFVDRCTIDTVLSTQFIDATEAERSRMLNGKTSISKQQINNVYQEISQALSLHRRNGIVFGVALYDTNNQITDYFMEHIPAWFSDFILYYKKNQTCFSLDDNEFLKYPLYYSWVSDPFGKKFVCKLGIRSPTDCPPGFYPDCASKCIYEYNEHNAPHLLSDFGLTNL